MRQTIFSHHDQALNGLGPVMRISLAEINAKCYQSKHAAQNVPRKHQTG